MWHENNGDVCFTQIVRHSAVDVLDQRCLRLGLGIQWHDIVRNADVRCIIEQSPVSSTVNSWHWHVAHMGGRKMWTNYSWARAGALERLAGQPCSMWLRNIMDYLTAFDMVAHAWWAFQVSQGCVESLFGWGGKCLHHFAANLFRKLSLFFRTQCRAMFYYCTSLLVHTFSCFIWWCCI